MKTKLALLLALTAPALQAATITWGASGAVSTSTEISTNGTLFEAWNVSGPTETINGVAFSGSPTNISTTFFNDINADFWASTDPAGPDGTAYGRALDDARWNDPSGAGTITITGLTAGVSYEVQVWNADTRGCCNNRSRTYTAGNTLTLNTGNNGAGQWGIGTFVADLGGVQTISVDGSGAYGPQLNMIQVRALIPEPSVSLLGLGALGLMLRRRRA